MEINGTPGGYKGILSHMTRIFLFVFVVDFFSGFFHLCLPSRPDDVFVFAGPMEHCAMIPVGISDPRIFPDNWMTASSQAKNRCRPANGRLNGMRGDGWCTVVENSATDWLQVDMGTRIQVCAVATQGDVNGNEWTTVFKLSYSSDEKNWTTYKDVNGTDMVTTFSTFQFNEGEML